MSGAVEHITLDAEPEPGEAPAAQEHRPTLHRYTLPGDAEGCCTVLSILQGQYLQVREVGARGSVREYQFDARFAESTPLRRRHIPWPWLTVTTGLWALGFGSLAAAWPAATQALGPGITGGLFIASVLVIAIYTCLRWGKESLQFRSVHGAAALISVTTGIGGTRRYDPIFAEISRSIGAARIARPQEKPKFLRDEMREHYRLHQLGILSERQYEASKAAILAAH